MYILKLISCFHLLTLTYTHTLSFSLSTHTHTHTRPSARHIHYIPEICAAFCWCAPALNTHWLPYFYPLYLTPLLFDRAWRDDLRMSEKYGKYYARYCDKVPHKVIPGVV